jgi:hypothetical protein
MLTISVFVYNDISKMMHCFLLVFYSFDATFKKTIIKQMYNVT